MHKTYHFKSLSSTQEKAKELAKEGVDNSIVIAETQTKGRGRFGRKWISGKGGLWMSIAMKQKKTGNLQFLTFAAAVSVVKSIKKLTGLQTKIKWPNDVHYKAKKLCGILTEGKFGRENRVVIGIGLNVNQDNFPDNIKDVSTSLKIIKKKNYDLQDLASSISSEFFRLYKFYEKSKFGKILDSWKKNCDTIGKDVTVITSTNTFKGTAIGIDENCSLLLKLSNNKITKIIEGDLKVRY